MTAGEARYDVILDNVGRHPIRDLLGIASPDAVVMPNSGTGGGEWLGPLGRMAGAFFRGLVRRQSFPLFVAMATTERLGDLVDLASELVGPVDTVDPGIGFDRHHGDAPVAGCHPRLLTEHQRGGRREVHVLGGDQLVG